MAFDEFGSQPINAQPDPAKPIDEFGSQPIPKMPDMSSVQKMANDNLAAAAPKPDQENQSVKSPVENLNTAVGMPVPNLMNPDDKMPISAGIRQQYTKQLQGENPLSFGGFMQTLLHTVAPIAHGLAHPIEQAEKIERVAEAARGGIAEGAEFQPFGVGSLSQGLLNAPFQAAGAAFSAYQRGVAQAGVEAGFPKIGTEAAMLPEEMMGTEGIFMHPPAEIPGAAALRGPWDNLPGSSPIKDIVSKDPAAASSPQVDQAIAQGTNHKAPAGGDFKDVATVSGIPEPALHTVYNETGVRPDQVFTDAQYDHTIAVDVAAGKVPEAYEHLVEPKPVLPTDQAEKLNVEFDETTRSYRVVDADGDHVSGGFDSHEEAKHYIEDEKFKTEEAAAIEEEGNVPVKPITEKTPQGEQTVIPGAEKIAEKSLAERIMGKLLGSDKAQKPADEGLFDVGAIGQGDIFDQPAQKPAEPKPKPLVVQPSEFGKPTSLRTFLSNNGAKFNEANELVSIKKDGERITGGDALDYAHELAKEHGYLPKDEAGKPSAPVSQLQDHLTETNGGREATRAQDADRIAAMKEAAQQKQWKDPAFVEDQAHKAGIDTDPIKDESVKDRNARLIRELTKFYADQGGNAPVGLMREAIGNIILAAEKFVGKLSGGFFDRLGQAYIKTFQPELAGDKALRLDAYLAKFKAAGQEAEHAFYSQFRDLIKSWDKKSSDQRMEWIYDHETGRWNEETDPDHAQFQSLLDVTFKAEKEAIGADAEKGYKDNYLPLQFENAVGVKKFFASDAMVRKYGADWFTKARSFDLIQDAVRAGFKLKTDNPGQMLVSRLMAGDNMIRTMDLLKDMEGSGVAVKASLFSIDKKIARTKNAIADLEDKYKKELEEIRNLKQETGEGLPNKPPSKTVRNVMQRLNYLKDRLDSFQKDKAANKLTPEQMADLKSGLRIVGPNSKVYMVHPEAIPLWKNAMEMKGLWENQGIAGDAYRSYMQGKAIWTQVKLGLSLFHPVHVAMIDLASDVAAGVHHLMQGGKLSDLMSKEAVPTFGTTREWLKGQDHPAIQAWNTKSEERTPEQHEMVRKMVEGGLVPAMSARDTVHFRENFDKAINGIGTNNLRLLGSAASLPGVLMKPFFEHWIPGMKAEIYLRRYDDAIKRDPTLSQNAGKRGEVARQIAKDTDRTYGEMNNEVQFWNKNVRDSFNAAFISGGWKLAQIYNAKGLLQPANIAHKFLTTGEFSKADITYNMLHAYTYTALTLALGGAINKMLGNPIGTAKDDIWDMVKNLVAPQTGEKNPDGTPMRLNQPAFAKEGYNLAHEINTKGLIGGAGDFLYHQTLLPGIADTLNNRDFSGHELISNPTDLHQWMNAGWNTIIPISYQQYQKAEQKQSDVGKAAGALGFPMAGAYLNQTRFEQKVIARYDDLHPPTTDAYTEKLKYDLKSAIASHDTKTIDSTKQLMKEQGMTPGQIQSAETPYTKKFVETAWKKLSIQDQKRLIDSATDEERTKFTVKSQ